jgi:hypothetical protein
MDRCRAIKPDGERCGGRAIEGSELCWNHDPTYAEARRRNAAKGGRRAGRGRPSPVSSELVRLQGHFEEIAEKVLAGEVERGDGAVVAQLLNGARACVLGLLKAREHEELIERVEELERRLQSSASQWNSNRKGRRY